MLPVIGSFTPAIPGEPVAIGLINNSHGCIKSLAGAAVAHSLCRPRYQWRVCVRRVIPAPRTAFRHYSCESKRPSNCYINALFDQNVEQLLATIEDRFTCCALLCAQGKWAIHLQESHGPRSSYSQGIGTTSQSEIT